MSETKSEKTITKQEIDEALEKRLERAKTKKHEWRQRGPWLVCISCENEHATWVGREKRLVGMDEKGNPILEDV